jgi:hypothetical protein
MNRWWTVALLLSSHVFVCGCGGDPTGMSESEAARVAKAIRQNLTKQPTSVNLSREEQDGSHRGPIDVVHVVLEYDDDNGLDFKGLRFEATHRIVRQGKVDTTIKVSCVEGDERIAVYEMEFYYLGDTMGRYANEKAKQKGNALKSWCREIRKALVKVLPKEPRSR